MAGTPASLKMLTQLLVSNEVTGVEAEMWLTTLAFIQEPTLDMLAEVKVSDIPKIHFSNNRNYMVYLDTLYRLLAIAVMFLSFQYHLYFSGKI